MINFTGNVLCVSSDVLARRPFRQRSHTLCTATEIASRERFLRRSIHATLGHRSTRYRRTSLLLPANNILRIHHVLQEGDEAAVGEPTQQRDRSDSDPIVRTHSEGERTMAAARPRGGRRADYKKSVNSDYPTALLQSKFSQRADSSNETSVEASGQNGELRVTLQSNAGGFGFTFRSIRVYLGEQSTRYRLQHVVATVDPESPAFAAGIREGHLITEVYCTLHTTVKWQALHCTVLEPNTSYCT